MKLLSIRGDAPALRKRPTRGEWEYVSRWTCDLVTDEGVLHYNVSPGYWTDLASVPQILKGLIDNGSADYGVLMASQMHDFAYSTHLISRPLADELFYLTLRYYKMGWLKAQAYYRAVSWFGEGPYEECDSMHTDRELCKLYWGDR